jgi:hypothetical protein
MTPIEILRKRAKELMHGEADFIDSIEVELTDDPKYGWKDGQKLGQYEPLKKRITLYNTIVDNIFPTYMHELVHAFQHREMGTVGYLLMLGLCRWKLERDAREIEESFYR